MEKQKTIKELFNEFISIAEPIIEGDEERKNI